MTTFINYKLKGLECLLSSLGGLLSPAREEEENTTEGAGGDPSWGWRTDGINQPAVTGEYFEWWEMKIPLQSMHGS